MDTTIAIYVHHHGSGHLMRALQLAKALSKNKVILLGSALQNTDTIELQNVELLHLPLDVPETDEQQKTTSQAPDCFHYAPLGLRGIRDRSTMLTNFFKEKYPLLLVVDVSVEVTLLARLCGVPTVVIRQHGDRRDLPHQLAYQSAEIILAPFSREMYLGDKNRDYQKTIFTGGFSRFDHAALEGIPSTSNIGILIGGGGSSINELLVEEMASQLPDYTLHLVGDVDFKIDFSNVHVYGQVDNPLPILSICNTIIGNTGHNTVMEAASIGSRFIGIPEERPYEEQKQKASSIEGRRGIRIIDAKELQGQNWSQLIQDLNAEDVDWKGVINPQALNLMAEAIIDTAKRSFGS